MDSNGNEGIRYKLAFDVSITRKSPTPILFTIVLRISWSYLETPTPMDSNGPQCLSTESDYFYPHLQSPTPMDSNGL